VTPDEQRLLSLWTDGGLMSEGIGPQEEWSPVTPDVHQRRHAAFWKTVHDIVPDNEDDEPFWMTQGATRKLLDNHN
jgi:hypothetical protein